MPRERAKERDCENAIKKTLAYSGVFKYPLSYYQLTTYLMGRNDYNFLFFNKQLRRLLKSKQIFVEKEKYFLPGIKPVSWQVRLKASKDIFYKTKASLNVLRSIPWIKMVAITGSAAASNADKGSDVDILVISKRNRVWLTRMLTVVILKILNLYPKIDGEVGKICANLYLDEEALVWPKDRRSVYVAHDLAMIKPLFERDNMYFKFISTNKWIGDYMPNFAYEPFGKFKPDTKGDSVLLDGIENILMHIQLAHMKKKKTKEITKKHIIHFNKNDNTPGILEEYSTLLARIQKTS